MVIRVLCSIDHFRVAPCLCFKAKLSVKQFTFILLQKRLIFTRKVFRFASLWNWEFLKLGNDQLNGQRLVAQFGSISWLNSLKTWPQKWTEVWAKRAQESLLLVAWVIVTDWVSCHPTERRGVYPSLDRVQHFLDGECFIARSNVRSLRYVQWHEGRWFSPAKWRR